MQQSYGRKSPLLNWGALALTIYEARGICGCPRQHKTFDAASIMVAIPRWTLAAGLCDFHVRASCAKADFSVTTTSRPTDTIALLRSDKPMAKEVFIGADGLAVDGKVKMGFLFDITERSVVGPH